MKRISSPSVIVCLLIAILIAAAVYRFNNQCGLSVSLVQQTNFSGNGYVYWDTGSGFNEARRIRYAIKPGLHQYRIHLPAASVRNLRLVQVRESGAQAEVFRVSLLGDSLQYVWSGGSPCLQQRVGTGQITSEACSGSYPTVEQNSDASILISNIPASAIAVALPYRIALAVAAFLIVLCGGYWLTPLPARRDRFADLAGSLGKVAWLMVFFVFALQLYRLARLAVDVPYLDEWTYFAQGSIIEGFSWSRLFAFHNEHRIVLTKLMTWLNMKFFALDFFGQQIVNYLMYGLIVAVVVKLKQRMTTAPFHLFPLFVVFLLSPLNIENHMWGFQSQFHLVVIFSLLALAYSFNRDESARDHWIAALCILLAAYSFSAGVVLGILLLASRTAFAVSARFGSNSSAPAVSLQAWLPSAVAAIGLACWFIGYKKPEHHPDLALPFSAGFWDYFLNVLSFGFGVRQMSLLWGVLCLALVLTPLLILWVRRDPLQRSARWHITATIMSVLAFLAVISMGRAGIGVPKSSRYAEFGLLLIPFGALAWQMALPPGRVRGCLLTLFWLFCAYTTSPHWSDRPYRELRSSRLLTLECVERYYNGESDGACAEGFKKPIGPYMDAARAVNVSFTRQFTTKR